MPALDSGFIALWFGSIASIPAGFVLCNGNNGTPDLRDRFVVGAGDTYDPDDSGGATQHNHPFTGDGHNHQLPISPDIAMGANFSKHTDSQNVTGTTDNTAHLPPYHSLAYIMKT